MSYKYAEVEGIRKVKWDELWHVLYTWGGRETWDRVTRQEAMKVLQKMETLKNKTQARRKPA